MANEIVKADPGDRPLETLAGGEPRTRPTETKGRPGFSIFGGYIVENEKSAVLTDRERYRTYSDIIANTSIVAASLRYFLGIIANAEWQFKPSEADTDGEFAAMARRVIIEDPETAWHRVVRRAAMFRFYGFSIQEWTVRRAPDGIITYADIAPRAQRTIERWRTTVSGKVLGVFQTDPQTNQDIYLEREKLVYVVDDTLNDSPQGLGVFRHLVSPAKRLARYEQLEGFGFETDLRGVPVGRAPYAALRKAVDSGDISQADAASAISAVETFIRKHLKNPELGLVLDSAVYTTIDDAATPSQTPLFGMDLLTASSSGLPDIAKGIERVNCEIARIMGTENLLLGSSSVGSHALSKDKSQQFTLGVNGTLKELADSFERDLRDPIWAMNGWPDEMKPTMQPESVAFKDIEEITSALRDMAQAGATLAPDDEAINDVRGLLGVSMARLEDAMLGSSLLAGPQPGASDGEEEIPDDGGDE